MTEPVRRLRPLGGPRFTVRRVALMIALTAAWCGLWGELSLANVLGGLVLTFVATTPLVMTTLGRPIRLGALVRLIAVVAVDLVQSTAAVVREVLTPTDHTDESEIEVEVGDTGLRHLYLLVVAITLTPGTAVVDVDTERGTLLLHLLHGDNEPGVRRHVERLVALAERALPSGADATAPDPNGVTP